MCAPPRSRAPMNRSYGNFAYKNELEKNNHQEIENFKDPKLPLLHKKPLTACNKEVAWLEGLKNLGVDFKVINELFFIGVEVVEVEFGCHLEARVVAFEHESITSNMWIESYIVPTLVSLSIHQRGRIHGGIAFRDTQDTVSDCSSFTILFDDDDGLYDSQGKVDSSKALDASLVVTESSGTESDKQDTSSRSGNDTDALDADIRLVSNEEPRAEYFKPPPNVDHLVPEVPTPVPAASTSSPSSTTVDQDAHSRKVPHKPLKNKQSSSYSLQESFDITKKGLLGREKPRPTFNKDIIETDTIADMDGMDL
ncbi:hypothetical protein Tco_0968339 [Tanacetum coccineum]